MYRLRLIALLLSAATAGRLGAWWASGHESVAYIAWQQMTPAARARAIVLIKLTPTLTSPTGKKVDGYAEWVAALPAGLTQDEQDMYIFMRGATWADAIKHVGFTDSDVPPPGITNDVNIGFTDSASHGYWHFIDTGFASYKSTVPATPAPNAVTQIAAFRDAVASGEADLLEAYDLLWLEHVVGDIHQPLHASTKRGGQIGERTDSRMRCYRRQVPRARMEIATLPCRPT